MILLSNKFFIPLNFVLYENPSVFFVDCDDNFNIDVKKLIGKMEFKNIMFSNFLLLLQKTSDPDFSIFLCSLVSIQKVQATSNSNSVDKKLYLNTLQQIV